MKASYQLGMRIVYLRKQKGWSQEDLALEANINANYYTISQVNALVGTMNNAINTLADLFKVNGTIVSMADLMDTLSTRFAEIDAAVAFETNIRVVNVPAYERASISLEYTGSVGTLRLVDIIVEKVR